MPLIRRHTNWQNEIGVIAPVSDPRKRVIAQSHPQIFYRIRHLARDVFDRQDNPGMYNIHKSSVVRKEVPVCGTTAPVKFVIKPWDTSKPQTTVEKLYDPLATQNIKGDYIEANATLDQFMIDHGGDDSILRNKYEKRMNSFNEMLTLYTTFAALLVGNEYIEKQSVVFIILTDVIKKAGLVWDEDELLSILQTGVMWTWDRLKLLRILELAENLHEQYLYRKWRSVLQYTRS